VVEFEELEDGKGGAVGDVGGEGWAVHCDVLLRQLRC